jgi:DnaK suppressor protein
MIMSSRGSEPLTPDQLGQIRDDLLRTLAKLERNFNKSARPADLDQTSVGRLSRIEALQNQGMTQGLQEREKVQLAQVTEALRRIDHGGYGCCVECGVPIQFERLLVFPETPTCATCGSGV